MTDQYVIHVPRFDGDAPPYWKAGDYWSGCRSGVPSWLEGKKYRVELETVEPPVPEAFLTWARANPKEAMELATKAQEPEGDWADLTADIWYNSVRNEQSDLADLLRKRCRPIDNDVSDEWLAEKVSEIVGCTDYGMVTAAKETLRAIIREAQS